MKSYAVLCLIIICVTMFFCGCSQENGLDNDGGSKISSSSKSSVKTPENIKDCKLSDKAIEVNGTIISFPVDSKTFIDVVGAEKYSSNEKTIEEVYFPRSRLTRDISFDFDDQDKNSIWTTFVNTEFSEEDMDNSETVYILDSGVKVYEADFHFAFEPKDSIVLPSGIDFNSSYDDVIAAYGEPSETKEWGNTISNVEYIFDDFWCTIHFNGANVEESCISKVSYYYRDEVYTPDIFLIS